MMYGLFKQAKFGNAPKRNPRSGMKEKSKYDAWVSNRGTTEEKAKHNYIMLWSMIEPKFSLKAEAEKF